ncbi:MAG: hypothetical protein J6T22_01005 [Bacteroidales bacterium]|jgi:hypothetical protein|nr:hypothetical protein [Bacteroidales bacterium]
MKNYKLLALICALGVLSVSCNKDKNEWDHFYGYTLQDVMGSYSASNVSDAFEDLTENAYCHICNDAQITITSSEFKILCPSDDFSKSFPMPHAANEDVFMINSSNPSWSAYPDYELVTYVYKNDKGEVRLHGFARHVVYETVYENGSSFYKVKSKVNYYFDVIKN